AAPDPGSSQFLFLNPVALLYNKLKIAVPVAILSELRMAVAGAQPPSLVPRHICSQIKSYFYIGMYG
ncbi:MAG: hypothetical protein Q6K12_06675, partial [Gloeomargarita sp. DG_1_6_bins_138]